MNIANGIASDLNSYRFSTKPFEASSRLVYYGYRYYDPECGRWPSLDPVLENGGINLYSFTNNEAISDIDVLGLQSIFSVWSKLKGTCGGHLVPQVCELTGSDEEDASEPEDHSGYPTDPNNYVSNPTNSSGSSSGNKTCYYQCVAAHYNSEVGTVFTTSTTVSNLDSCPEL